MQKATTSVPPPPPAAIMECVSAAWEAALATARASPQGERALRSRLRHVVRQPWHLKPQLLPAASMRPASACHLSVGACARARAKLLAAR